MELFRLLGQGMLMFLSYLGEMGGLARGIAESLIKGKLRWRLVGRQIVATGFGSQLVVIVTGAFTGAVLTAQTFYQFRTVGMETTIGGVVAVGMFRELGPVLAGLMVAGRVGAAMCAEIGTMKVSEQIDALRALGVHPVDYLVTPRMLAMMISMPLLVAESIAFGILFSWIVAVPVLDIPSNYFLHHQLTYTGLDDMCFALIKGFFFGIIIVLASCLQGFNVRNGAEGVGRNTTVAVVSSSLLILVTNFFLTIVLNRFFPAGFVKG
jgi:phospholipid/cholesterol/gamma-HCH transport system permease protein